LYPLKAYPDLRSAVFKVPGQRGALSGARRSGGALAPPHPRRSEEAKALLRRGETGFVLKDHPEV
jgi:hypothetical protein